jgi:hypothetical protein
LGLFNEEKGMFDLGWQSINISAPLTSLTCFNYTKSSVYSSYPYSGVYATYVGGGYTYELSGNATQIQSDFQVMQQNNWIDRQTRAVFLEYPLYNANINLFSYCLVLFEFLPTGTIVSSFRFDPINLLSLQQGAYSFNIMISIIYMCIVFVMSLNEIRKMIKLKRE